MNYYSTAEIAKRWGITAQRITILAKEGRIPGATQIGMRWLIPEDAEKPTDGRTKAVKTAKKEEAFFRFPMYLNAEEGDFFPPLTDEERQLRQAQVAFYGCRIEEAMTRILPLCETAKNRYVRIAALYLRCCLAVYAVNHEDFNRSLSAFHMALAEDFPHKKDMLLLRYRFDVDFGFFKSLLEGFRIQPNDAYHPSSYDTMAFLSILSLVNGDLSLLSKLRFENYELLCLRMEQDGHFYEAQELHYLLLSIYQIQANEEMMLHHMRCGLKIAMEHELYFRSAVDAFYYPSITFRAIADFPNDFAETILLLGSQFHEKYVEFSNHQNTSYWSILSNKEFMLVAYALQDYSNKEIAKKMKVSEKTVSKRYGEMYEKLGIQSKQELIRLIYNTHQSGQVD